MSKVKLSDNKEQYTVIAWFDLIHDKSFKAQIFVIYSDKKLTQATRACLCYQSIIASPSLTRDWAKHRV